MTPSHSSWTSISHFRFRWLRQWWSVASATPARCGGGVQNNAQESFHIILFIRSWWDLWHHHRVRVEGGNAAATIPLKRMADSNVFRRWRAVDSQIGTILVFLANQKFLSILHNLCTENVSSVYFYPCKCKQTWTIVNKTTRWPVRCDTMTKVFCL